MTNELIKILTDLEEYIGDLKSDNVPDEVEFLAKLKELNDALTAELKKPQPEQKTIDPKK